MKRIMFAPFGHPSPRPCASLQNSRGVESVYSLLLTPLSSAENSHIFPAVRSMAAHTNSWASTSFEMGLKSWDCMDLVANMNLPNW